MTSGPGTSASDTSGARTYRALPGGIWVLGFVSIFMDISSELVHSLLWRFNDGKMNAMN